MPVGIDFFPELPDVFLTHLELVLGPGGQCLEFLVDPFQTRFREHHTRADAFGPVADDELLGLHCNFEFLQRGFQGKGTLEYRGLVFVFLIDPGDDSCLFNGGVPGLREHFVFQNVNAFCFLQIFHCVLLVLFTLTSIPK